MAWAQKTSRAIETSDDGHSAKKRKSQSSMTKSEESERVLKEQYSVGNKIRYRPSESEDEKAVVATTAAAEGMFDGKNGEWVLELKENLKLRVTKVSNATIIGSNNKSLMLLVSHSVLYNVFPFELNDVAAAMVTVQFKGVTYVDIRKYWNGTPTQKGICLPVDIFRKIQRWGGLEHALSQVELT